jgi:hypothetical protein
LARILDNNPDSLCPNTVTQIHFVGFWATCKEAIAPEDKNVIRKTIAPLQKGKPSLISQVQNIRSALGKSDENIPAIFVMQVREIISNFSLSENFTHFPKESLWNPEDKNTASQKSGYSKNSKVVFSPKLQMLCIWKIDQRDVRLQKNSEVFLQCQYATLAPKPKLPLAKRECPL